MECMALHEDFEDFAAFPAGEEALLRLVGRLCGCAGLDHGLRGRARAARAPARARARQCEESWL